MIMVMRRMRIKECDDGKDNGESDSPPPGVKESWRFPQCDVLLPSNLEIDFSSHTMRIDTYNVFFVFSQYLIEEGLGSLLSPHV